jgi:hypothetical protein
MNKIEALQIIIRGNNGGAEGIDLLNRCGSAGWKKFKNSGLVNYTSIFCRPYVSLNRENIQNVFLSI